jgi:Mg2+ and Co2+ transporter CorA
MGAVQRVLRPHLQQSEALREIAELVGKWLIEQAREAGDRAAQGQARPPETSAAVSPSPEPPVPEVARSIIAQRPIVGPMQIAKLRLGDAEAEVPVKPAPGGAFTDEPPRSEEGRPPPRTAPDLRLIEQRCRLKAESCRLFMRIRAARREKKGESALLDEMNAMIERARTLPECFLWVFWQYQTQPANDLLARIALCYDALAEASDLMRRVVENPHAERTDVENAMALMAEANNMLRIVLEETWLTKPDQDQEDAHAWLRWETKQRQVFIGRYMRIGERADPARAEDLLARIRDCREMHERTAHREREIAKQFNRIRFHVHHAEDQPGQERAHDFGKIAEAIRDLCAMGVPATDERFSREIPAHIAESIGPVEDQAVSEVLRRVIEQCAPVEDGSDFDVPREWSENVRRVRAVLEGRKIVVVGGEPRREVIGRLEDAFGAEVEWVRLAEHGSGGAMRAPIARPETAAVLVIVKLVGHLHADEARECARAAGRPCISLPAGYNPEQVAAAVIEQAGERLGIVSDAPFEG